MAAAPASDVKSSNITWHAGSVTHEERFALLGQRGMVLWFTGLSASGKSTLAVALEQHLLHLKINSYRLDGDNIRFGLNKNLGFSPEDRTENIRRIGEVAKLFADAGVVCLTSFISPYRADRENVRKLVTDSGLDFIEVRAPPKVPSGAKAKPDISDFRRLPHRNAHQGPRPEGPVPEGVGRRDQKLYGSQRGRSM